MSTYFSDYVKEIHAYLQTTEFTTAQGTRLTQEDGLKRWVALTKEVSDRGGFLFFAGNGASATMSEHFSHDFFQNGGLKTMTCSETAHLTAIGNDLSFEDVFAFRIGKTMSEPDMLVTISSSGNSPNIVKAIKTAKGKGASVVTISGKSSDNTSRKLGDLNVYVPAPTYGTVESCHAVLLHCWLDMYMDKHLGGRH